MKALVINGADFSGNAVEKVIFAGWNSFTIVQGLIDVASDPSSGNRGSIPQSSVTYYSQMVRTIGTIEVPAGYTLKTKSDSNPLDLRIRHSIIYNHSWEESGNGITTMAQYWVSDQLEDYIEPSDFEYTNNSGNSVFIAFNFVKRGGAAITPQGFTFEYELTND